MSESMSDDALKAIASRRARSLTAIVEKELERMIVGGELRSGERLNEQILAQRFGVSRGPIREAMRALEQAGLVSARLNQGFFVRQITPEEIGEIYEMRAVVYGYACARLAAHIDPSQLGQLADDVARMDAAIVVGDAGAYYRLNLAFHDRIMGLARHERARQIYESLINQTHLTRQRSLVSPDRMRASNDEHKALLAAFATGDVAAARRLGEEHGIAGRRRWQATLTDEAQTTDFRRKA